MKYRFYETGQALYPDLLESFAFAKKEILVSLYSFHNDKTGRRIAEVLRSKAEEGIRVRVIFDALGSWGDQSRLINYLEAGGVEVKLYRPLKDIFFAPFSFLCRNHARIILVDEKMFGVGGISFGDVYQKRKDMFILGEDIRAYRLKGLFNKIWKLADMRNYLKPVFADDAIDLANGDSLLGSGPKKKDSAMYEWLIAKVKNSKDKIQIASAWFMPPSELARELILARQRGVTVEVVTPGSTDRPRYDGFRSLPLEDMMDCGIAWYTNHQYFHSKFAVIDEDWYVGSSNFDIISLARNYELNLVGSKGELGKRLSAVFKEIKENSDRQIASTSPLLVWLFNLFSYSLVEFFLTAGARRRITSHKNSID